VVIVKIDHVDTWARQVTFKSAEGLIQTIHVPKEITIFDELEDGDLVKIRYRDSYVLQVKPGAPLTAPTDTTADARAAATDPNDQVLQQVTATVKVDSIDLDRNVVVYEMEDTRKVTRQVVDKRLLEGLQPGDIVTLTYTRDRAVSIERVQP
jgi:hypothetical protein